jgi:hypothetical protein
MVTTNKKIKYLSKEKFMDLLKIRTHLLQYLIFLNNLRTIYFSIFQMVEQKISFY